MGCCFYYSIKGADVIMSANACQSPNPPQKIGEIKSSITMLLRTVAHYN